MSSSERDGGRDSGNVFTDAFARDASHRRRTTTNLVKRIVLAPVRLVVFVLLVASVLLPPALGVGLVVDGIRHQRVGSIVLGAIVLLLIATLARAFFRRKKSGP